MITPAVREYFSRRKKSNHSINLGPKHSF
ncbi:hypothetical protein LINGRAHAP2_LOCUS31045 [Linum grandiflorum]